MLGKPMDFTKSFSVLVLSFAAWESAWIYFFSVHFFFSLFDPGFQMIIMRIAHTMSMNFFLTSFDFTDLACIRCDWLSF